MNVVAGRKYVRHLHATSKMNHNQDASGRVLSAMTLLIDKLSGCDNAQD
jgi:hypothetical protein